MVDIEAAWLQLDGKTKSVDIAVMDALLLEVLNSVAEREVARVKQSA